PRAAADGHSLRAARRPFRGHSAELPHAWRTDRAARAGRGLCPQRGRHDENDHAACGLDPARPTAARLLRPRAARAGDRARRLDQCGDDRARRAERRRRHARRARQRLHRAGAVVESRCDHHHRPGFRGECFERPGLGAGCRRARPPRASLPEAAVRLGRFPPDGEPVDRPVVACENPVPGFVPGEFARTDAGVLRALLPRDAERCANRAGAGGPRLKRYSARTEPSRWNLQTRRLRPSFIIAPGLLGLGLLVAFAVGRYPVTLAELIEVFVSRLAGRPTGVPPAVENVVLLVRGPRVVAAALVGAALAVAGTAFQGLF